MYVAQGHFAMTGASREEAKGIFMFRQKQKGIRVNYRSFPDLDLLFLTKLWVLRLLPRLKFRPTVFQQEPGMWSVRELRHVIVGVLQVTGIEGKWKEIKHQSWDVKVTLEWYESILSCHQSENSKNFIAPKICNISSPCCCQSRNANKKSSSFMDNPNY